MSGILIILASLITQPAFAGDSSVKQIRTYMSYSYPVDPVRMVTMPDMNVSYALASTLVQWDSGKQLSGGVANFWEPTTHDSYIFKIRGGLKWSDGTDVTALDVKESFERAFKDHPEEVRSFKHFVKEITVRTTDTLEFVLNGTVSESDLLGKLTEPNFGILKIENGGHINLAVSTGPFFLASQTDKELILKKNANWFSANGSMADEVVIRKPSNDVDLQNVLIREDWPNLVEANSLLSKELMDHYKGNHFEIWTRPLDKIFLLQLSKYFVNQNGPALIKFLRERIDRQVVTKGVAGLSLTDQVFPEGYQLHDQQVPIPEKVVLPEKFKTHGLVVLYCPTRVNAVLLKNIKEALTSAIGLEPQFKVTQLDKLGEHKKIGDYDIYLSALGLADPDPEGVMSYYFEGALPVIPQGSESFVAKLDAARRVTDKNKRLTLMRELITEATVKGHLLPLFHLSTVGIGRPGLDFSHVPKSDESVTLSKIRFTAKKD
jgi:MarR-like DNA-binding transcriptional regulator SgrR of sgrS sRNA